MKIGKVIQPSSAICTSNEETIIVRGSDLCNDIIGKMSFIEYFYFLLTGEKPNQATLEVVNATLISIAEHGFVPSVQAARMTFAASPEALQGAVAAGLLGCGSVILGASANAGEFFTDIRNLMLKGHSAEQAATEIIKQYRIEMKAIPGYGHPLHKERDPRVTALFKVAENAGSNLEFIAIADAVERVIPEIVGKQLKLNVSAAIPAVLLGAGFPLKALRGIPILARCAGLIAHLYEEQEQPVGFALSYQATREFQYTGTVPEDFKS